MSPQYIPVPSPTTTMIVSGVIALGLLLLLSAFLGVLGKKKWHRYTSFSIDLMKFDYYIFTSFSIFLEAGKK